uniref:Uncharacterized protein n=1 Tax=Heterorhabditis bacteriophora TaxID=37862 RepID=A0A1I7WR60_HETBA
MVENGESSNHPGIGTGIRLQNEIPAEVFLVQWKKRHFKSYQLCTLLGMWLIPVYVCITREWYRFLVVWMLFTICSTVVYFTVEVIFIDSVSLYLPLMSLNLLFIFRLVYKWFLLLHKLSYVLGIAGYLIMIFTLMGLNFIFSLKANSCMDTVYLGILLLFYGLYYGVLGRDFAHICTDRMACKIGSFYTLGCLAVIHFMNFVYAAGLWLVNCRPVLIAIWTFFNLISTRSNLRKRSDILGKGMLVISYFNVYLTKILEINISSFFRLDSRSPSPSSKSKESNKPIKSIYSDDEDYNTPQFNPPKKNFDGELKPGLNRVVKAQTKSEKLNKDYLLQLLHLLMMRGRREGEQMVEMIGKGEDGKDGETLWNRSQRLELEIYLSYFISIIYFVYGCIFQGDKSKKCETKIDKEIRLLRLKDILKQKNGVKEIEEFRKRYFERRASGMLVPPL